MISSRELPSDMSTLPGLKTVGGSKFGLLRLQAGEQIIGGRATGATLGGEQLDKHRDTGIVGGVRRRCCSEDGRRSEEQNQAQRNDDHLPAGVEAAKFRGVGKDCALIHSSYQSCLRLLAVCNRNWFIKMTTLRAAIMATLRGAGPDVRVADRGRVKEGLEMTDGLRNLLSGSAAEAQNEAVTGAVAQISRRER
jgi:hypothetical protein